MNERLKLDEFVFISDNIKYRVLCPADILALEVNGNYTRVILSDTIVLIRRTLSACERRLDPTVFFRVGRDCIVNLGHVKKMEMADAKRFLFILSNGQRVPFSRKQTILFRTQKAF